MYAFKNTYHMPLKHHLKNFLFVSYICILTLFLSFLHFCSFVAFLCALAYFCYFPNISLVACNSLISQTIPSIPVPPTPPSDLRLPLSPHVSFYVGRTKMLPRTRTPPPPSILVVSLVMGKWVRWGRWAGTHAWHNNAGICHCICNTFCTFQAASSCCCLLLLLCTYIPPVNPIPCIHLILSLNQIISSSSHHREQILRAFSRVSFSAPLTPPPCSHIYTWEEDVTEPGAGRRRSREMGDSG